MGDDGGQQHNHIAFLLPHQYLYQPLDSDSNEIRLLRITDVDDLVHCTIGKFALDENPVYTALSYTWSDSSGNDEYNKNILLDGHVVGVTSNLEAALRELAKMGSDKYLWLDALCIDQTNMKERQEQVRRMDLVYSRADLVVSWLGGEQEDSHEAFQLLRSFKDIGLIQSLYDISDPWTPGKPLSDDNTRKLHAVIRLFKRHYWTRAWVAQEMALARNLVLYCGSDHMTWEDTKQACDAFSAPDEWITEALRGSSVFFFLPALINGGPWLHLSSPRPGSATLCELLLWNRWKFSKEPSDMVYSILGIASHKDRMRVSIDYSLGPDTFFQRLAAMLITEDMEVRLLAENKPPILLGLGPDPSLPSWAVNWANPEDDDKFRIRGTEDCKTFCASGTCSPHATILNGEILHVQGVHVGTITRVGCLMPATKEADFEPVFDTLWEWWLMFFSTGRKDFFGEGGFQDILNMGQLYTSRSSAHFVRELEQSLRVHLTVIISLYRPDDVTIFPTLDKPTGVIDESLLRQAKSNVWTGSLRTRKRKYCLVDGIHSGFAPQRAEAGDVVVVVPGVRVPLVLRERPGGYINLGDSYVHGFMYGEAVKDINDGKDKFETFSIY